MQASETKLQNIIEGTKQYVIPLFQRTYSWTSKEWDVLWKDLVELFEEENPKTHFIGSIVNMPTTSVPEGVSKFLLIDGQQRLTTIFIILILLRNKARESQNIRFADEINNTLLVNQYKDGDDHYKILPTQFDRQTYKNLIDNIPNSIENQLTRAYDFFYKKFKQKELEPEKLKKIVTSYFSVVSIVLDSEDNPYLVFESLNAKGRPLTQADLIRNYFFMRIHVDKQDEIYNSFWKPMQIALGDSLTEYIRHFLMRKGSFIKQGDVYFSLKENISVTNAIEYLKELNKFSGYYQRLLSPEFELDIELQKYLKRLNRIEVTTAYPLLLNFYNSYTESELSKPDFIIILKTLENFLIRRFVCNTPSNQLNKIFSTIYSQISDNRTNNIAEKFKTILQTKGYPKDKEFSLRFKETKFYGGGDRVAKTKLILESIEEHFTHKEQVPFDKLTIEHIMPQKLSEWWQNNLDEYWEETHDLFLHTIGNLTLTGYNAELSNDDFPTKKNKLIESHLEMNKYFKDIQNWHKSDIELRAEKLAMSALEVWKYFGEDNSDTSKQFTATGKTPIRLSILGQKFPVQSWRDVMEKIFNTVADLEPEKFNIIIQHYPSIVGKDKNKFREFRALKNGYYIEMNLSAQAIQKLCNGAMETIELTSDDWSIDIK